MKERMGMTFALFNGHISNAFDRARQELTAMVPAWMERVDELEREGNGIMHLLNVEPEPATVAYITLVTYFVNENA